MRLILLLLILTLFLGCVAQSYQDEMSEDEILETEKEIVKDFANVTENLENLAVSI